jgi:hypothetical protein
MIENKIMPKLTNVTVNDTCFLCGSQAFYISFNSKKLRCVEKVSQCPGHAKKAQASRDANITTEERKAHMKRMSENGNTTLKKLHEDPIWRAKKSANLSNAIKKRGGNVGSNNPMYGKTHKKSSIEKQKLKAKNRDPITYVKGVATKITNGICTPKELKDKWELYLEQVNNFTSRSWKEYQHIINPSNLPRGKKYELDHKFSKFEGFNRNIPPEIIGHYKNLELISRTENRSKRTKCSITLEELYESIRSKN